MRWSQLTDKNRERAIARFGSLQAHAQQAAEDFQRFLGIPLRVTTSIKVGSQEVRFIIEMAAGDKHVRREVTVLQVVTAKFNILLEEFDISAEQMRRAYA